MPKDTLRDPRAIEAEAKRQSKQTFKNRRWLTTDPETESAQVSKNHALVAKRTHEFVEMLEAKKKGTKNPWATRFKKGK